MLRGDVPIEDLTAHLDRVRAATRQPVSTAEPWHVWIKHPELAAARRLHRRARAAVLGRRRRRNGRRLRRRARWTQLAQPFPGKPIVIGEVGWPSDGRTRDSAVASVSNEALFLRRFLARRAEAYIRLLHHGSVRPALEGDARRQGRCLLGRVRRRPQPEVRVPRTDRADSALARARRRFGADSQRSCSGCSISTVTRCASAAAVSWPSSSTPLRRCWSGSLYDFSQQYLTVTSVLVGAVLIVGMLGVIAVLFAEAHEWAEAHWVTTHTRLFRPRRDRAPHAQGVDPRAGVQRAAGNADRDARCAGALDYPDYEVLVVDNNTRDEAVWRPVEAHCAKLGARFRFFHVAPLDGFKAGALNFALARTAPDATVDRGDRQRLRRATGLAARPGARPSPSRRTGDRAGAAGLSRRAARAPSRRCATRNTAGSSTSA